MAYQNVGTPRFYINDIDYAKSVGLDVTDIPDFLLNADNGNIHMIDAMGNENYLNLINSDPNSPMIYTYESSQYIRVIYKTIDRPINFPNYIAYLNHNMNSCKVNTRHCYYHAEDDGSGNFWNEGHLLSPIVNAEFGEIFHNGTQHGHFSKPLYDGFSIHEITNDANDGVHIFHACQMWIDDNDWDGGAYVEQGYPPLQIGSVWVGRYYDMPHSPELDLTMTIENDGFESIITEGGAHLSNVRYTGAPMWERNDGTEIPPWTIGEPTSLGRRNGRRVWSLSFNYLSDSDLFASNYMSTTYLESGSDTGYDSDDIDNDNFYYTLDNDDSFHAQVLNRIGNGQRFIFQPDNNNNNPDQFAICQLDQESLNIKQVAYKTYNIKLKIREVW